MKEIGTAFHEIYEPTLIFVSAMKMDRISLNQETPLVMKRHNFALQAMKFPLLIALELDGHT